MLKKIMPINLDRYIFLIILVLIGFGVLVPPSSAIWDSNWYNNSGCWTKFDGVYKYVMWNTTTITTTSFNTSIFSNLSLLYIDYLVVGGGGGGGGDTNGYGAGGGGGGGYRTSAGNTYGNNLSEPILYVNKSVNKTLTIKVGSGGAASSGAGVSGQDSFLNNGTTIITATGGGGGAFDLDGTALNGGSGGGGGGKTGGITCSPPGIGTQGGRGGNCNWSFSQGGGGGGAFENGTRNGGRGMESSISGILTYYAGGGGGENGTVGGIQAFGGLGGGGSGGVRSSATNTSTRGVNGTGGGGGAAGLFSTGEDGLNTGSRGGSGVVILRYNENYTFSMDVNKGISPLSVNFTDTTGDFDALWFWSYITDIDPSVIQFSSIQNPSYIFTTGNYSITLNNMSPTWVNVSPSINYSINYNNISDVDPLTLRFDPTFELGNSYIELWNWDFGDGNTSILQSPIYQYKGVGDYTTTLTVKPYGGSGVTYSTSKLISIPQLFIFNIVQIPQTRNAMYLFNDSLKTYGTGALPGCITAMDVPELGGWLGISTSEPMVYHQQIVNTPGSGFGSVYSGTANFGTAADIATSDSGSFSVEGRGLFADIYLLDGTRKGTYTTGGIVKSVDLALKNGLWAVAGGEDGKLYIFSKDSTSAWYVFYQGDSGLSILSTAMSWRGEYSAAGRSDGSLEYYTTGSNTTSSSTYLVNIFVSKGGYTYTNANISVVHGAVSVSGVTDSYGKYSFSATDLVTYVINVNNGEYIFNYQATSSYTTVTINIPVALMVRPFTYTSSFNNTSNIITTTYTDVNNADVNITITDISNNTIVHMADYLATTSVADTILGDSSHEYRVNLRFVRTTGTVHQDTLYVKTSIFGKITHTPDQWKLFEYGVYCLFLMFVALGIGTTSPKYGVILIPALVVLGVIIGFLPASIWLVPLLLSVFIAMTEVMRTRHG